MLIDTERAKKRLLDAGLSEEQASAHLDVLRMVDEQSREALATKADLQELEATMKADLQELEATTKNDLRKLETKMYRTAMAAVGFLAALMTLLRFI